MSNIPEPYNFYKLSKGLAINIGEFVASQIVKRGNATVDELNNLDRIRYAKKFYDKLYYLKRINHNFSYKEMIIHLAVYIDERIPKAYKKYCPYRSDVSPGNIQVNLEDMEKMGLIYHFPNSEEDVKKKIKKDDIRLLDPHEILGNEIPIEATQDFVKGSEIEVFGGLIHGDIVQVANEEVKNPIGYIRDFDILNGTISVVFLEKPDYFFNYPIDKVERIPLWESLEVRRLLLYPPYSDIKGLKEWIEIINGYRVSSEKFLLDAFNEVSYIYTNAENNKLFDFLAEDRCFELYKKIKRFKLFKSRLWLRTKFGEKYDTVFYILDTDTSKVYYGGLNDDVRRTMSILYKNM